MFNSWWLPWLCAGAFLAVVYWLTRGNQQTGGWIFDCYRCKKETMQMDYPVVLQELDGKSKYVICAECEDRILVGDSK